MFNIPGRLPMPDKKQGSFHTSICTFHRMRLLEPELEPPAKKAPAYAQIDPQHKNPATSNSDQSSKIAFSRHLAGLSYSSPLNQCAFYCIRGKVEGASREKEPVGAD